MKMNNNIQQYEEIVALKAIYGSDFKFESPSNSAYSIAVSKDISLFFTFDKDYPSRSPPTYTLFAPSVNRAKKKEVASAFHAIYEQSYGKPLIHAWISKLGDIVDCNNNMHKKKDISIPCYFNLIQSNIVEKKYHIIHGKEIVDRKSVFQGHVCYVSSIEEVSEVRRQLLQNKKIAQAKHNIQAYRINLPNGKLIQENDDDGEKHASGRLLRLLQMNKSMNVVVIVTRWYGGVQLGQDRFKHINKAARQALQKGS